ncbi:hypothetical protein BP5796_07739 [Coleophoma crateriformis]|uniref:CENP-V/GFA domain-containing protein n=1 Tax=Coleophoma crateriformis TaxID=565419 RepID=A0A3D8RCF1_9HELO|nr:hypothetical protein BP5796_07739 [Coleophoma crateriformis]
MADQILTKKYSGNCHCGLFRFTFEHAELQEASECNCSICTRNGYIFSAPLAPESVEVTRGEGQLKEYRFGKKEYGHSFCPHCGTSIWCQGEDKKLQLNLRTLQDFDMESLKINQDDWLSVKPPYEAPTSFPELPASTQTSNELVVYHGTCHCQRTRLSIRCKPLETLKLMSCNCSLCSRNGDLWIYPPKGDVAIAGEESLVGYAFLSDRCLHTFCGNCGNSLFGRVLDEDICPVNVRCFVDIESKLAGLERQFYNGKAKAPTYVLKD